MPIRPELLRQPMSVSLHCLRMFLEHGRGDGVDIENHPNDTVLLDLMLKAIERDDYPIDDSNGWYSLLTRDDLAYLIMNSLGWDRSCLGGTAWNKIHSYFQGSIGFPCDTVADMSILLGEEDISLTGMDMTPVPNKAKPLPVSGEGWTRGLFVKREESVT